MAKRTKIDAEIDLATLLDLRDKYEALAAYGVLDMQMAAKIVRKMLESVRVTVTIPLNDTITASEGTRLAKIAAQTPEKFIPAFVRAVATERVEQVVLQSSTKVQTTP